MTSTLEKPSPPLAPAASGAVREVGVAIIGSGFAGLGMAIALKRRGESDFVVLERADDVGGTWRDNTYPGAACDVQSNLYSFSFAPNPDWPRSYSEQPEIQAYLQGVGRPVRRPPALRLRRRRRRRAVGRRRAALARAHRRRRVPGPGPRLRRRRPGRPDLPRHPRPGLLRGHGHALGALGPRARPAPASASPSSAPAPRPSRSSRPSSRSSTASRSTSARPPGWCPAPTTRSSRSMQTLYRFVPGLQKAVRAALYLLPRVPRHRHGQAAALPQAGRPAGAGPPAPPGARPEAAQGADAGLHDRLQADPDQQRLLPRRRRAQRRAGDGAASPRCGRARSSRRTASSGRRTRSCWPPASTSPTCRSPRRSAAATGAASPRSGTTAW